MPATDVPAAVVLVAPDGDLRATVHPDAGMIISSLRCGDAELLGQRRGLAAYRSAGKTMGIPLLAPWANRLGAEHFEVAGVALDLAGEHPGLRRDPSGLPIHGLLAADAGWTVTRRSEGELEAVLDFGARPELLRTWPFPHRLTARVRLAAGSLELEHTVEATGLVPVPLAHGLHPYLVVPGVRREAWVVDLPARRRLVLDELGLPTGEGEVETAWSGVLGARTFDDAYDGLVDGARFAVRGGGWELTATFLEGYPAAQVFAPADDGVICFEPMAAPTNAPVSGRGLTLVAPGERARTRVRFGIRRLVR